MRNLVYKEINPHPWRFHKWERVDGTVGLFGLIRQCAKCHLVEVDDILMDEQWRGPASMLVKRTGTPAPITEE